MTMKRKVKAEQQEDTNLVYIDGVLGKVFPHKNGPGCFSAVAWNNPTTGRSEFFGFTDFDGHVGAAGLEEGARVRFTGSVMKQKPRDGNGPWILALRCEGLEVLE